MSILNEVLQAFNLSKVGANATVITPTITTSAGAYSSGDCIGGLITLTDAVRGKNNTATLRSIHVNDGANQGVDLTILIFNQSPTGMTTTDNSAFAFGSGNGLSSLIGKISVASADYQTIDSKKIITIDTLAITGQAISNSNLYAVVLTTGTPTYGSGTDKLSIVFNFWQD